MTETHAQQMIGQGWLLTRYGPLMKDWVNPSPGVVGDTRVWPGDTAWFTSDDWEPSSFVHLDEAETELWVSVVMATEPGNGALSRLLAYAEVEEWTVHVPSPFPHMEEILTAKDFVPTIVKAGGVPCEVWVQQ